MSSGPRLRIPILVFLGSLLLQCAWTLALPAFGGIDEFDHSYRASAVARGQWVAHASTATRGTGAFVDVPPDIVEAAHRQCADLPYTKSVDCTAQEQLPNGLVTVASGAGRYHPLFYWLVGTPATLASGSDALFIMRLGTALLSSLFLALAVFGLQQWARTRWPLTGLLLAMTPVAVYSTSIVAPNGVEITAAAALWCCLAGVASPGIPLGLQRRLLYCATPAAMTLATVRSLGPLWLALVVVVASLVNGWRPLWRAIRSNVIPLAVTASLVVVATLASLAWIRSQDSLVIGRESAKLTDPVHNTVINIPLWLFQGVAAFPTRGEQAPAVVYACCIPVLATLFVVGWRVASPFLRGLLTLTVLASVGIPLAIGIATYAEYGSAWQGRYGLPFAMGIVLLPAWALERVNYRHRLQGPVLVSAAIALVVAHAVSVVDVYQRTHAGDSHLVWLYPHVSVMILLVVLGCSLCLIAVRSGWPARGVEPTPALEEPRLAEAGASA